MRYPQAARDAIAREVESMLTSVSHQIEQLGANPSPSEINTAQSMLRFRLAANFVPSVMAATCAMFAPEDGAEAVDWAHVVNGVVREVLEDLGDEPLPRDAEFLKEMSKRVDPDQVGRLLATFGEEGVQQFSRHSFDGTMSAILE